ncbi:MAG: hypothetical protein WC838_02600 [Candidatus Margulisiibacteriota bacterium]|jgi:hypothetical protein
MNKKIILSSSSEESEVQRLLNALKKQVAQGVRFQRPSQMFPLGTEITRLQRELQLQENRAMERALRKSHPGATIMYDGLGRPFIASK